MVVEWEYMFVRKIGQAKVADTDEQVGTAGLHARGVADTPESVRVAGPGRGTGEVRAGTQVGCMAEIWVTFEPLKTTVLSRRMAQVKGMTVHAAMAGLVWIMLEKECMTGPVDVCAPESTPENMRRP